MKKSTTSKIYFKPVSMGRFLSFLFILSAIFSANGQTTLKERLEKHVYTLASDSMQGRKAGTEYARMASEYIVRQWEEIGIEPYRDYSFLQIFNNGNYRNIVGIIRGNDAVLKNEYIVVGAHYDHLGVKNGTVYNGADDNASGVAALIELARELKLNQSNLKRSVILIAFDAEEVGLIGSTYFMNHLDIPVENIKLMISVDMVGWYKAKGEVEYEGSGTIKNGKEMILSPQSIPAGLHVVTKNFESSIFTATDTESFATKGIPTLAVTTGQKSPYHKPEDDAELIDYEGLALITGHLKNTVETVSQSTDYAASGKVAKKHRGQQRFTFGLSASIGSNHHYYTDGAVDGKSATSYGVSLVSQVNFGKYAIRPEVSYERIRAKYPAGTVSTDNLTVPLSFVLQTVQRGMGADLFVGGYYSYHFDGKQGKEKIDFENTFNRSEGGLTVGFSLFVKPIKIGFTNRKALTNFTRNANADNAHLRNRTSYFTMTYLF
ncbi:MAG: M20/M25/M40 family metallo-hydrolase [Tannerella sp.]|jgi:hypothetical protein|nr:M20/M25/M40 family metallo-hydrolase [Tannerella sp.]